MKKHTAMFLSFTALLTLNAYAPQVFWSQDLSTTRLPANVTIDNKIEERASFDKEVKDEAEIECLKEKRTSDLEAEVKKLIADKQAMVKEMEELKKIKSEEPKKEDEPKKEAKKEKKDEDDVPRFTSNNSPDVFALISQLTSVMLSQQQQQTMLMQQMFSMMGQSLRYSTHEQVLAEYMNPYDSAVSKIDMSRYPTSSFSDLGQGVGIQARRLYFQYPEQPFSRDPSAVQQQFVNPALEHYDRSSRETFIQPEFQGIIPHNGFNFSNDDMGSFEKNMF